MNVSELFQSLSFGELSNLSMANEGSGIIVDEKQPKVIRYANEALLRLYSRFVLREDDVLVEMEEHITTYELKARYAETYTPVAGETPEKYRYIKDLHTKEPFRDDVIRILKVFNSLGREMPLNNEALRWSVFTPRPKVLQVPIPLRGQALSIAYQAKHPTLAHDKLDESIELPDVLEGALFAYVASSIFTDMGGQENIQRGQTLMKKYETICIDVEDKDVISVSNSSVSTLFEQRGFV